MNQVQKLIKTFREQTNKKNAHLLEDHLTGLVGTDIDGTITVIVADLVVGTIAQESADYTCVTLASGFMERSVTGAPATTPTRYRTDVRIGVVLQQVTH